MHRPIGRLVVLLRLRRVLAAQHVRQEHLSAPASGTARNAPGRPASAPPTRMPSSTVSGLTPTVRPMTRGTSTLLSICWITSAYATTNSGAGRIDGQGHEHRRRERQKRPDHRDDLEQTRRHAQQDRVRQAEHEVAERGHQPDGQHQDELAAHPAAELLFDFHPHVFTSRAWRTGTVRRMTRLIERALDQPVVRQDEHREEAEQRVGGRRAGLDDLSWAGCGGAWTA